jgi:hypothetical protein
MAADTDTSLGHAMRDQARHFGEARLRKAKERGSQGWAREPGKPLLNTTGLWPLRSASMSGVDVKGSYGFSMVDAAKGG